MRGRPGSFPASPEQALADWRSGGRVAPVLLDVRTLRSGDRRVYFRVQKNGGDDRRSLLPLLSSPDFDAAYCAAWRALFTGDSLMTDSSSPTTIAAPDKAPSPGASHKIAELYMTLDEAYDRTAKAYKPGWSDARIAKDIGVAETLVAQRRDADFGPVPKSKEEVFLDEISSAAAGIDKWLTDVGRRHTSHVDHLQVLQADQKQIGQDIARLRDLLAQLNRAIAARWAVESKKAGA